MLIIEFIITTLELGLPMLGLSWFLYSWLYRKGDIDRDSDSKTVEQKIKALNKLRKKEKKQAAKDKKNAKGSEKETEPVEKPQRSNAEYVFEQWTTFGGGFYGLAALWTFAVVEVLQFIQFIVYFPGFAVLFEDGVINLMVDVLLNQLSNVITAFVWFSYWEAAPILVTVLVAYGGYLLGKELAKRGTQLPVDEWVEKFRNRK